MSPAWGVARTPQSRNDLTLKSPLCSIWKTPWGPYESLNKFCCICVSFCCLHPAPSSLSDKADEGCLENMVSSISQPLGSPCSKVYDNHGPGLRCHRKCTGHGFRNPSHIALGPGISPSEENRHRLLISQERTHISLPAFSTPHVLLPAAPPAFTDSPFLQYCSHLLSLKHITTCTHASLLTLPHPLSFSPRDS